MSSEHPSLKKKQDKSGSFWNLQHFQVGHACVRTEIIHNYRVVEFEFDLNGDL